MNFGFNKEQLAKSLMAHLRLILNQQDYSVSKAEVRHGEVFRETCVTIDFPDGSFALISHHQRVTPRELPKPVEQRDEREAGGIGA